MNTLEQATRTQLTHIQAKTGKSLKELSSLVRKSGLTRHGEIREKLIHDLGLGYGDANALVHAVLKSDGTRLAGDKSMEEVLAGIYSGQKVALRPIHDALMSEISKFGDFEIVPKKGYISLRRRKQFVMLGPSGRTRIQVGLNVKDLPPANRLVAQPRGSMCNYLVMVTDVSQVNAELVVWCRFAYESAE